MVRNGYAGATTKQIAEAAGINEVTLFRRFGSKANLLRQAMLAELESFGGPEGIRYSADLRADLCHLVRAYERLLERRGRLIPLLLAELPRHAELAEVVELPQRLLGSIAGLVGRYQKEGALIEEPPIRAVASLLAPLLMPALLGDHAPEAARAPLDVEAHVDAFLGGHRR
jgi:AcrR family transcriptional regulator